MKNRRGITGHSYMSVDETTEMVNRALEGDQIAYTKLFVKFKPILFSVAKKRFPMWSYDDIEDEVVAFLGEMLSTKLSQFDREQAQFSTWITFCFHNKLNNFKKRKKRVSTTSIDDFYQSDDDGRREYNAPDTGTQTANFLNGTMSFRKFARILLKTLPKKQASILVSKYWYGLTDKEIEKKYNLSKGTAWYQTKKAINDLRSKVNKNDFI